MQEQPAIPFRQFHIFQILKEFEKVILPLDRFLNHYFRMHTAIGSKDRRFIGDTIYEIIRWQLLLDKLGGVHPTVETRYAIFQAFQPSNFLSINSLEPHIRISFPKELFQLLKEHYGEEQALSICQISNTKAPLSIRVNPLKSSREVLLEKLQAKYSAYPTKESSLGIQFKERASLLQLPEYKEGHFEIQDEASQLVCELLPLQPDDHLLDYCAGSGGKSLGCAHKIGNKGAIYLHDTRPHILVEARKRMERAGITKAHYLGSKDERLKKLKGKIDCLLLDVPCSGTGTLRRNPDQKWRFSLKMLENLIATQRKIFQEAIGYVKTGGVIVYVTCSVLQEENEAQIAYFLKNFPLTLEGKVFSSQPTFEGMDGLFAASLRVDSRHL